MFHCRLSGFRAIDIGQTPRQTLILRIRPTDRNPRTVAAGHSPPAPNGRDPGGCKPRGRASQGRGEKGSILRWPDASAVVFEFEFEKWRQGGAGQAGVVVAQERGG
jgi:hypothetical protein